MVKLSVPVLSLYQAGFLVLVLLSPSKTARFTDPASAPGSLRSSGTSVSLTYALQPAIPR